MFSRAYQTASEFTRPVVMATRDASGKCGSGVGTYIVVNDEGWILTAAHVLQSVIALLDGTKRFREHAAAVDAVKNQQGLSNKDRKAATSALGPRDPKWMQNCAIWWSDSRIRGISDVRIIPDADLGLAKLNGYVPGSINAFPVFRDPALPLLPGTSVCRLGFPFANVEPIYENNRFVLPPGVLSMPLFPNEGIITREHHVSDNPGGYRNSYVETTSPGLLGQSGGPLFDQHCVVYGVQSKTSHLPLGFSPKVPNSKSGEVEHQFLNLGLVTSPATTVGFLREHNISHQLSSTP